MILFTSLFAEAIKGHHEYEKKCKKCHGSITKVSTLHDIDGWKQYFDNDGLLIKTLHGNTNSNLYFESQRFRNKVKHIQDAFESNDKNSVCKTN